MISMIANLWASAGTFRHCTAEKVSFVLLNQLDLALTVLASYLGLFELNPVMRYIVTIPVLLVVMKSAIPLLIAWIVPGKLLLPANILLCLVVSWNLKELLLFLF